MKNAEFREKFRKENIPFYYWGIGHMVVNFVLLSLPLMAFSLKIDSPSIGELLFIPMTMILGNLAVFVIHKYPLHRKIKPFGFAYKIHSQWHHRFYTDQNLEFDSTRDWFIIFFPIDVVLGFIILVLPLIYFALTPFLSVNGVFLVLATSCFYFISYEVIHFISHLSENNILMKFPYFRFMRNYHRTHHDPALMNDYNFNIVFPFFDLIFNTAYKGNKNVSGSVTSKKA
jgi:Fatty acid hydroxylase superfamily